MKPSPVFGTSENSERENPFKVEAQKDSVERQLQSQSNIEPPVINPRELFKLKLGKNRGEVYESERNKEVSA